MAIARNRLTKSREVQCRLRSMSGWTIVKSVTTPPAFPVFALGSATFSGFAGSHLPDGQVGELEHHVELTGRVVVPVPSPSTFESGADDRGDDRGSDNAEQADPGGSHIRVACVCGR